MDLGVSETNEKETSYLQRKCGSTFAGAFDVDLEGDRELQARGNVHETSVASVELLVDSNQLGISSSSSPDDLRLERSGSPCDKSHLFPTESYYDQENSQPPFKNEDCQGEIDELSGSYIHKSSFQFMEKTSHSERGTEDSACSHESLITVYDKQTEKMEGISSLDRLNTTSNEEEVIIFQEKPCGQETEPNDQNYDSRNSLTATERLVVKHSHSHPNSSGNTPRHSTSLSTLRQMSVSPERSSHIQQSLSGHGPLSSQEGAIEPSHPPSSSRHRKSSHERSNRRSHGQSSLPKRPDQANKVPAQDNVTSKQTAVPPQRSQHKDSSYRKRKSVSPAFQISPRKYGRLERSVSPSPVRQRDSSSRYKKDQHGRSPTRSQYTRDRYRSSRRKYSPSQRSSPGCHSSQYSPRRKPWVPPPNRRTGLGKLGNNLFVAGFSFLTTERDLERKFSRYGRVQNVRIVRDKRSGDSRGFGFLSLERDEDADAAIRALDETEWDGRIILVEKSKSH
ncbi:hypothetical protein JCGZ_00888 [Jatropha curcas]|uniref:RRM domain-containing protein n=1 Tax=Jatropha curcas TaxID=180498 RepID=A0A067KSD3_JATCU|nr:RNA-binding protein rsd1 [Jatropha curcas]XP_020534448.1 RNA-binding protein rsd1 [Jatropha curcas]XP_020534449.1 RNA-binding protein rsd1 [Jatropha curcas]XP_020534450.1 RNA-binding protein rsd1 [Jatropha curcas]KDP39131.1 hypothetical protein JCGZ_00888 [Jatropha curcas]